MLFRNADILIYNKRCFVVLFYAYPFNRPHSSGDFMRSSGLIYIIALLAFLISDVHSAQAWYCKATSQTGSYGWGSSPSRRQAIRIALNQCAIRTPRYATCRLRYCD
jgi:hypothetical protein